MNLDIISKKLEALRKSEGGPRKKYTKLPILDVSKRVGKFDIRILPNKYNSDIPFVDVYVYFMFNGKVFLSPTTFGDPDPILQFASKVQDKEIKKKFTPTFQVYAPVIVRGEEQDGVKYWRFSKTVFKDLLDLMSSEDYADLADIESGVDLTLEYIKETSNGFPQTSITPRRKSSPATNSVELTNSLIESQIDVLSNFTRLSYEELETELQVFLSTQAPANSESSTGTEYNARFDKEITEKITEEPETNNIVDDLDSLFK